ncbi:MAG: DUF87 domain-containing protein, partial [Chloroflexota bacterium]|nr:DUF87 domain-containing protein [Chloroflexota bacterium]
MLPFVSHSNVGDTRSLIPVAHIGSNYVLTRNAGLVLLIDVAGPKLETEAPESVHRLLWRWVEALLAVDFEISHLYATDIPRECGIADYFWSRASALQYDNPTAAKEAARRSQEARHSQWLRYRSFMICRKQLPAYVHDIDDPRIQVELASLRNKVQATCTAMSDPDWTIRLLNGGQIEQLFRDLLDPYGFEHMNPSAPIPAHAIPSPQSATTHGGLGKVGESVIIRALSQALPTSLNPHVQPDGRSVLNRIAPDDIAISANESYAVIDGNFCRAYVVDEPPPFLSPRIMAEIYYGRSYPIQVSLQWRYDKGAAGVARARLTETMAAIQIHEEAGHLSNPSDIQRAHSYRKVEEAQLNGEPLIFMVWLVQVFGQSEENLREHCRDIEDWFSQHAFTLRVLNDEQDLAIASMLPIGETHTRRHRRNVEPPNIASLYLHGVRRYDQEGGLVFGRDPFRSDSVRLNLLQTAINTTMLITGSWGSGKSTTGKDLLVQLVIAGKPASVVDLEGEYEAVVRHYGGQVIDLSPRKHVAINLLDPRFDWNDFLPALCILAEQPIIGEQKAIVMDAWQRVRAQQRVAVLSDLAVLLRETPETRSIAGALQPFLRPPYDAFFNQPTNIDLRSPLRCFVLREAANDDTASRALLYLTWLFGMEYGIDVDGETWTVVDEG